MPYAASNLSVDSQAAACNNTCVQVAFSWCRAWKDVTDAWSRVNQVWIDVDISPSFDSPFKVSRLVAGGGSINTGPCWSVDAITLSGFGPNATHYWRINTLWDTLFGSDWYTSTVRTFTTINVVQHIESFDTASLPHIDSQVLNAQAKVDVGFSFYIGGRYPVDVDSYILESWLDIGIEPTFTSPFTAGKQITGLLNPPPPASGLQLPTRVATVTGLMPNSWHYARVNVHWVTINGEKWISSPVLTFQTIGVPSVAVDNFTWVKVGAVRWENALAEWVQDYQLSWSGGQFIDQVMLEGAWDAGHTQVFLNQDVTGQTGLGPIAYGFSNPAVTLYYRLSSWFQGVLVGFYDVQVSIPSDINQWQPAFGLQVTSMSEPDANNKITVEFAFNTGHGCNSEFIDVSKDDFATWQSINVSIPHDSAGFPSTVIAVLDPNTNYRARLTSQCQGDWTTDGEVAFKTPALPVVGGGGSIEAVASLVVHQWYQVLVDRGWTPSAVGSPVTDHGAADARVRCIVATAIAGAETGDTYDGCNPPGDHGLSTLNCNGYRAFGLWQIRIDQHNAWIASVMGSSDPCVQATWLCNPINNAFAADHVSYDGVSGMAYLSPWEAWNQGTYASRMAAATVAVDAILVTSPQPGTGGPCLPVPVASIHQGAGGGILTNSKFFRLTFEFQTPSDESVTVPTGYHYEVKDASGNRVGSIGGASFTVPNELVREFVDVEMPSGDQTGTLIIDRICGGVAVPAQIPVFIPGKPYAPSAPNGLFEPINGKLLVGWTPGYYRGQGPSQTILAFSQNNVTVKAYDVTAQEIGQILLGQSVEIPNLPQGIYQALLRSTWEGVDMWGPIGIIVNQPGPSSGSTGGAISKHPGENIAVDVGFAYKGPAKTLRIVTIAFAEHSQIVGENLIDVPASDGFMTYSVLMVMQVPPDMSFGTIYSCNIRIELDTSILGQTAFYNVWQVVP